MIRTAYGGDMAVIHGDGHPIGQSYCDALRDQLNTRLGDINRRGSKSTCAFWQSQGNAFAHIYHKKGSPEVKVYFRTDPDFQFTVPNESFHVEKRPEVPEKGWGREFPSYFVIKQIAQISDAVGFLVDYAFPLATRKREASKSNSSRVPNLAPFSEQL